MQYNTYYRKDVWEKFEKEEKKSELVNHLLEQHYEDVVVKPGSFKEYDNGDVGYTVNPKPKVIKTKQDAVKAVEYKKTQNWGA